MAVSVSFWQFKTNSNFEQATVFGLESEGYWGSFGKNGNNSCSLISYLSLPYICVHFGTICWIIIVIDLKLITKFKIAVKKSQGTDNWLLFLNGILLFWKYWGSLCLSQSQALPNGNLQMCRERIVVHWYQWRTCESDKSLNLICIMLMSWYLDWMTWPSQIPTPDHSWKRFWSNKPLHGLPGVVMHGIDSYIWGAPCPVLAGNQLIIIAAVKLWPALWNLSREFPDGSYWS